MSNDLTQLTDEAGYCALQQQNPELLAIIEQYLSVGGTAQMIEQGLAKT